MAWWQEKPMRLIQTNLRETDATLDIDEFIGSLEQFSADVLLFNVGGIVANYPSELEFHFVNTYMKDDLIGKVIERVHALGMKFIARFDFSKLNEKYALANPDWLYRSVEGKIVNYNGQVHACINGFYQQEYSLQVLKEVAEKYPIDGVFFNMQGYVTYDYSYNYHGICQCDSCRKRFAELYGHDQLPVKEEANDPVFRDYERFRTETVKELFAHRVAVVKKINPKIAICNYNPYGTDIFRKESNTGIDRELPEWNYSATENVKTVLGSWDGMAVSNSAVHFVDFAMRYSAVSPNLTAQRLVQNMVNGGWLDYYVIGTLNNQDDRLCFKAVKDIYRFHKEHEAYYTNLESLAEVCLVVPDSSMMYGSKNEFKGIMRILTENHVQYDLLHDSVLEQSEIYDKLQRYKVIILADQRSLSEGAATVIDRYVEQGGKLLATGFTSTCDSKGNPLERIALQCLGVKKITHKPKVRGAYFRIREADKVKLDGFEMLDLVYLYGEHLACELEDSAEGLLSLIPSCMFGPPEKCYIADETDTPGLIVNHYGKGKTAYFPWGVGAHYEKLSNHGHDSLFVAALWDALQYHDSLEVNASPLIEVTFHKNHGTSCKLISLVNLSGQLGTAFHAPLPVYGIRFNLWDQLEPTHIHALRSAKEIPFVYQSGQLSFSLDQLELFETIVIE